MFLLSSLRLLYGFLPPRTRRGGSVGVPFGFLPPLLGGGWVGVPFGFFASPARGRLGGGPLSNYK